MISSHNFNRESSVVLFSGGQDSTTCLGWAKNRFDAIETVSFDYGQRHSIELEQAKKITELLNIKNTIFSIDTFKELSDSSLIDKNSQLDTMHHHKTNLPSSYVPNRNALMLTIAHAYAQKQGIENIITGVCQTDYSGYPDCREEFVKNMESAPNMGSESNIKFHYPLMHLTKAETFKLAEQEGILDIVLEHSHTCYEGDRAHRHDLGLWLWSMPRLQTQRKWVDGIYKGNFLNTALLCKRENT